MELCKKKKKKKFQSINRDSVKKKESEYSTMFKIGEEEEHRQMGKISSNDVHSREAKISGGARSSLFYFFFLSLKAFLREGMERKRERERGGCFHSRGGFRLLFYDPSARGKRVSSRGRLCGEEEATKVGGGKETIEYIYICNVSSDFQRLLVKLCFRDQVTFHSTDDRAFKG